MGEILSIDTLFLGFYLAEIIPSHSQSANLPFSPFQGKTLTDMWKEGQFIKQHEKKLKKRSFNKARIKFSFRPFISNQENYSIQNQSTEIKIHKSTNLSGKMTKSWVGISMRNFICNKNNIFEQILFAY